MVDGRVIDPFKAAGVRYKRGSKRQKRDETNPQFIARFHKTFPKIIKELGADLELVALAFSKDISLIEAAVAANGMCKKAYSEARRAAAEGKEVADLPQSNVGEERDKRLKKSNWPVDPDERTIAIREALMVSLVENKGSLTECGTCLNLSTHQILQELESDPALAEMREVGLQVAAAMMEDKMVAQALDGNITALKMGLVNLTPDRWSDKQSVSVKHEGFSPPVEEETKTGGVLSLVKGNKDAS